MPETFPSLDALDVLLDDLRVGEARRRQLGMVRGELEQALVRGALPVGARRSLRRLLEREALTPYVRLARSGQLRARRLRDGYPPTSDATNEARAQCLDLLCKAYGLPAPRFGAGGRVPPRPTSNFGDLAALRRQLDQDLGGYMSHGHTRLTAVVALVLDAAPRSGELVAMRLSHLRPGAVYVDRRPQGGGEPDGDWFELSPIGAAALGRWLPLRKEFVDRTHGTSRLWVSLHPNHDGVLDAEGQATLRPAGVPLEDKGMTDSYAAGRVRYGLDKLPPKLEQLRRAVLDQTPPVALDLPAPDA